MDAIDFTGESREKSNDDFGWDGGIHGESGFGSGTGAGMCTFCGSSSYGNPGVWGDGAGRDDEWDWGCGCSSGHGHVNGFGYGWGNGSGNGSGGCSGGQ